MDSIEIRNKTDEWKILAERLSYLEENINRIESMIRNQQTLEKQLADKKTEFKQVCERLRNLAIELNQ
jgi:prefoldin subunit 5